jgi:protease IV
VYLDVSNIRPPQAGNRHSCLVALLIILAIVAVMAGGLAGLAYLIGDSSTWAGGDSLGVIRVEGVITESDSIVQALKKFGDEDHIKAIILRIDSPGGGVAATQEIYKEIQRTKAKKNIIASMGSIAASGGLYVAVPADRIVANPATVTGSIGVIMHMMNMQQLMGKIGLDSIVIKSGKYKDIGSSTRPMTEEDRALLQGVIDDMYQQFVTDVAKARGLDVEVVRRYADGRIFTGARAKDLGLVDQLGNFEDAVNLAKKLAGLEGKVRLISLPEDTPWWISFLGANQALDLLPQWTKASPLFQYLYLPGI